MTEQKKPHAWMRRWYFDGENPPPKVVMGKRVRLPGKFKLLPVTLNKALPDDVPLYADADGAGWPTVDELAQRIRYLNGSNTMGAGQLAELLLEWMQSRNAGVDLPDGAKR